MDLQQELKNQLFYDENTGIFTRKISKSRRLKVGDVAGYKNNEGYIHFRFNGKTIKAHRAAWIYCYGEIPFQIDHINGNVSDNRILNLRSCTQSQNQKNKQISKSNTSGFKGVSYNKKLKVFFARASINKKSYWLGQYTKAEDASLAYINFAKNNHGEFFNSNVARIL